MDIRYKLIEHERREDSPFIGALISAIGCKFGCRGCFNRDLKKLPNKVATAEEIIAEVKANPFNEGIILGGLEWSLQIEEMLELIKVASANDLQIMIYTGCEFAEFHKRIGRVCADKVGFKLYNLPDFLKENDSELYRYIGACVLDYHIPSTYYVKCGTYDKTKLVDDRVQFGVKLASENQNIFKIERDTSNDSESK